VHFHTMHCQYVQQDGEHLHRGLAVAVEVGDHFTNEHRLMRTSASQYSHFSVRVVCVSGRVRVCACWLWLGARCRLMSGRLGGAATRAWVGSADVTWDTKVPFARGVSTCLKQALVTTVPACDRAEREREHCA